MTNGGRIDAGRHLERLFEVGTIGGLTDAELLERFAAEDREAARAAFEVIVERHGPMVLRVCRMVLRDTHAAEDAFQATFLVLARRAGTLGDRALLGNWLYGVAARTARKARVAAARRLALDRAAAGRRTEAIAEPPPDERGDELGRILQEEIDRLPGSYRAAVVACYLEGLTQAQAARQLRLTEGTVRGRLARARKLLGPRLTRRGVGAAVGLLAMENAVEASIGPPSPMSPSAAAARLPDAIVRPVARDALQFARSTGPATRGAVMSTAAVLAEGVLSTMWLTSFRIIAMTAALAAVGIGLAMATAAGLGRPTAEPEAGAAPPSAPAPAPVPGPAPDPRPAAGAGLPLLQESEPGQQKTRRGGQKASHPVDIDEDLAKRVPGPIIRAIPASKDLMVLSYLPDWNFGGVDNIGVGNSGSRTLIEWPRIPDKEAADPDRRFVLAIYARKTASNPPAGPVVACEILEEWNERFSWKTRPRYDPEPFATYKFEPREGWKLFDVTPLIRAQAKDGRTGHGVLLRFLSEDIPEPACSTYFFVSREGVEEWARRHPMLLVVKDAKPKPPHDD